MSANPDGARASLAVDFRKTNCEIELVLNGTVAPGQIKAQSVTRQPCQWRERQPEVAILPI